MKSASLFFASFFCLLFSTPFLFGQGQFVLIGGGGEEYGDWSDEPYQWAVEQSANKRVAVLTYSSSTNWIPDYFKSLGATEAKVFQITTAATANSQATFDSLTTYGIVFIKGGDQSNYYNFWKKSKVADALAAIYAGGGTLCGTSAGLAILAPVAYVATANTIYPDEAVANPLDPNITMADDFFAQNPWPWGRYIFESHTIERGRFARLAAFMANWFFKTGEVVRGIGVGDQTALTVDNQGLATVLGSGSVAFFENTKAVQPYSNSMTMLATRSLEVTTLLHGGTMNLVTGEATGLTDLKPILNTSMPELNEVWVANLSAATWKNWGQKFVSTTGLATDSLASISPYFSQKQEIESWQTGGPGLVHLDPFLANAMSQDTFDHLLRCKKFICNSLDFNEFEAISAFSAASGRLPDLKKQLQFQGSQVAARRRDGMATGASLPLNGFTEALASWNGELTFSDGFGLLGGAIQTETWDPATSDFYENTATAVPYLMARDGLGWGLFLNGNFDGRFVAEGDSVVFKNVASTHPAIFFFQEPGKKTGLASQLLLGHAKPRNVAGFEKFHLKFLAPGEQIRVGESEPTFTICPGPEPEIAAFPNPTAGFLQIMEAVDCVFRLFDETGRAVLTTKNNPIDLKNLPAGPYFLEVIHPTNGLLRTLKVEKL